jgi:hypothetical protein
VDQVSGFACEVELASFACGRVSLSFGPLEPGDILNLLTYIGQSESFREHILDRFAEQLATLALRSLDDA